MFFNRGVWCVMSEIEGMMHRAPEDGSVYYSADEAIIN